MQLKIEKANFIEISLDKISEALQNGLAKNYFQEEKNRFIRRLAFDVQLKE